MVTLRNWALEEVPDRTPEELKEQYQGKGSY